MFDTNDPSIVWVSPSASGGAGDGTFEIPFDSITKALGVVRPGQTIVLKSGAYADSVNFEISGTIHQPIRITADAGAKVEVVKACWFFYDASDLIVSGITFVDAPFGAISVIGSCERNRFENLKFINCGTSAGTSCTLYFGGSGGSCNVVENCLFEHAARRAASGRAKEALPGTGSIGLMVAEGDADHGAPIKDHVYRRNRFVNYDYGILIGTNDSSTGFYGHIVEYNTVENCAVEGILVKCGDSQVKGNLVRRCDSNSIDIAAGKGSVVSDNRVADCGNGIRVNGADHTVTNNCVVRCGGPGLWAGGPLSGVGVVRAAAINLFIENNTFVDCGLRIDPGTTCIIRRNLIAGAGMSLKVIDPPAYGKETLPADGRLKPSQWMAVDNIVSDAVSTIEGMSRADVVFPGRDGDDFTNDSGYGARGWILKPEAFDPDLDEAAEAEKYCFMENDDEDDAPAEGGEEPVETFDFESFMGNPFGLGFDREE
jgi:hypothetical protein